MKIINFRIKSDEKRITSTKTKGLLVALFLLFMSLCLAIKGSSLFQTLIIDKIKYGNAVNKDYDITEIEYINCIIEGTEIRTTSNDPMMIIYNIDGYVDCVSINFAKELDKNIPVQLFWSEGENGFCEENSIRSTCIEGNKTDICVRKYVSNLRIDIGNEQGLVYPSLSFSLCSLKTFVDNIEIKYILEKIKIYIFICFFIWPFLVFDKKKTFEMMFGYRWLLGGIILAFLVVNKYNGDSLCIYDDYIQPNIQSEWGKPIFGEGRPIRSDEWVVDSTIFLSTKHIDSPYGKYNNIPRGTKTVNENHIGWYSLYNVLLLGRYICNKLLGFDYAYSFRWYSVYVLAFLFVLELMYIISEKNKLLSFCGACLIVFSSFFFWWGPNTIILGMSGSIVCFYYFFESKDVIKKIAFSVLTAMFVSYFVLCLYPAWLVPVSYISLGIVIWIIKDKWEIIKKQSILEWGLIFVSLTLVIVFIFGYMYDKKEYMETLSNTVYPGQRVSLGGSGFLKLFNYIPAVQFAYKDYFNPSEAGSFITFFPLPICIYIYNSIKEKKADFISTWFVLVTSLLLYYVVFGVNEVVAKITLLSYSPSGRCVDILAFLQVLLFIRQIALWKQETKLDSCLGVVVSVAISFISVIIGSTYSFHGYISIVYALSAFIILVYVIYMFITRGEISKVTHAIMITIIISILTVIGVRPLSKGTGAVTDNPVAKKIQQITDKDENDIWIAYGGGTILPSFAVANGAPTLNSVNTYPNMELFNRLDYEGKYEEIYNRYCHIDLQFTESSTNFELMQDDVIRMNLSFKDILLLDVDYVLSIVPLDNENEYVIFDEIYQDDGMFIYKVVKNNNVS